MTFFLILAGLDLPGYPQLLCECEPDISHQIFARNNDLKLHSTETKTGTHFGMVGSKRNRLTNQNRIGDNVQAFRRMPGIAQRSSNCLIAARHSASNPSYDKILDSANGGHKTLCNGLKSRPSQMALGAIG